MKYIEYECGNCLKLVNHFKVDPGRKKQVTIVLDDYKIYPSKGNFISEIQLNQEQAAALLDFIMDKLHKEFQIDHVYQYGPMKDPTKAMLTIVAKNYILSYCQTGHMIDLKAPVITNWIR